jgi:hypothetical protein
MGRPPSPYDVARMGRFEYLVFFCFKIGDWKAINESTEYGFSTLNARYYSDDF